MKVILFLFFISFDYFFLTKYIILYISIFNTPHKEREYEHEQYHNEHDPAGKASLFESP